jgi:hypothetical protein
MAILYIIKVDVYKPFLHDQVSMQSNPTEAQTKYSIFPLK